MADFTSANLEGANELLNDSLTKAKSLKDSLIAQHGADASTMKSAVESKVTDLKTSISSLIPELPSIPNVSAQGEFAALADIDISSAAGLEQFNTQVANISSQFGDAFKDKGLDLDSLASNIQAGGDVGDLIPNFQLPDGETIPIELPSNIAFPSVEGIKEKLESIPEFKIEIDSEELKNKAQEALDAIDKEKIKQETESLLTLV